MRTGEFVVGLTDEVEQVAGVFQGHVDGLRGVGDDADGGNEQGGDDGEALVVGAVFVIEAVFAGDERGAEAGGGIVAAFDGAYQHAELCGVGGIAPAEIVEDGGAFDVSTDGGEVAQGFIYGVHGHPVGGDFAIQRVDAVGEGVSGGRCCITDGLPDCGMPWPVASATYQG